MTEQVTLFPHESPQSIFACVSKHLFKQDEKSEAQGACLYRGPRGLTCAVGCLLTDDEYYPQMENQAVGDIELPPRLHGAEKLLTRLQEIHDDDPVYAWPEALAECASDFNLEMP